jgi:hypothetical protein
MVAENDLALGRLVEAISGSAVWKESAIFVLEDDAQSGPDHVDAHRSRETVIERKVFSDVDAAGAFAINKMRAYTAP